MLTPAMSCILMVLTFRKHYFLLDIKDMLKDHHELKAALQKLASHDNQEIQLKANELLTNIEFSNPLFDVIL